MRPERIKPGPGQESVWDYPRPPRVEHTEKRIEVVFNGMKIADSEAVQRILETSHPPVYYIPRRDIRMDFLLEEEGRSFCEWKGHARYYTVSVRGKQATRAAWCYPEPKDTFLAIKDHLAFFPSLMDACFVNGEKARPQAGDFYGGWITSHVVGPFKGEPGSEFW